MATQHWLKRLGWLVGLLGLASLVQAESLLYQASYKGIFSAGSRVPIADIRLDTHDIAAASDYREIELTVSSRAYSAVEAFYPLRFRFRSWPLRDNSSVLAAEYCEHNPRSGRDHHLIQLDDPEQPFVVQEMQAQTRSILNALRQGLYESVADQSVAGRYDRLGLLQRLRDTVLLPGVKVDAAVTNGKKMLDYQVAVEKREQIQVAGRAWAALKLRFESYEATGKRQAGKRRPAHRPVYIWLSDDDQHIPLKAVSRHTLGRFELRLQQTGVSAVSQPHANNTANITAG